MKLAATLSILLIGYTGMSQLTGTTGSTLNTNCNGTDCNYSGPTILINELMISPTNNDGSISGDGGVSAGRGEWIELYNPNICEPIDISCYYLGNNTAEGNGGFVIPAGTIVPPAGFCMIRGANVPAVPSNLLVQNGGNVVEIVVPANVGDPGVCSGGLRLWFPNAGGWFAFYDSNGVPQDAVSWLSAAGSAGSPCIPTLGGCNNAASLPSYNDIPANRKNVLNVPAILLTGSSVRRIPDGGNWDTQGPPTYAICNATCIQAGSSSCTGTATVNVSGGTPPYTYAWDDSQVQTTQTAINLCAGTYSVTVTDNGGNTQVFQVTVQDFVPTVSVNLPAEICVNANPVAAVVNPVATAGQTGTLTGPGISGGNFNPTTAGVGNHTVNYYFEDQFGCSNTASDAILVHPLPVVSITNNQSPYCVSNNPAALVLSPAGGQLTGPGVVNNQFIPAQAGVGTHTLTYTYQDANGCSNSTTISVQVTAPNPPVLTVPSDLCIDGGTITMVAILQVEISKSTEQLPQISFPPQNEGIGNHPVSYSITDANGCIATASESIIVHALPAIQIPVNNHYCYESGFHTVSPTPAGGVFSGDNVTGTGINLSGVSPGAYNVTYAVTDQFGCSNTATQTYNVTTPINPEYVSETNCFQGVSLASQVQNPNYTYQWNILNTVTGNGMLYNVTLPTPGTYNLIFIITDEYGCTYDTTGVIIIEEGIQIETVSLPNIITPNGDGINDRLEMPLELSECFSYQIVIVNRWGNPVYRMENMTDFFDGHSKNGAELAEGVYFYYLESDDFDCDDDKYKGVCYGNITIIR